VQTYSLFTRDSRDSRDSPVFIRVQRVPTPKKASRDSRDKQAVGRCVSRVSRVPKNRVGTRQAQYSRAGPGCPDCPE